ncbi:hypothetical protein [Algoriphagus resistens]|uniref:hypothetical protein n=1 Tax=Algoriphagus resistens TaxID=1750590 RepID=UPI0007167F11|nr:hypothetical protein [Algoriphagus resistens]
MAFSKFHGNRPAIKEAKKLDLKVDHFYHVLLAELYKEVDVGQAGKYLAEAHRTCKSEKEKELIQKQIDKLTKKLSA